MRPSHIVLAVLAASAAVTAAEAAGVSTNLAPNASFESPQVIGGMPASWTPFTTKVNGVGLTDVKRNGRQCVSLKAQRLAGQSEGLALTLPVSGNKLYSFSAFMRTDPANPLGGTATGVLCIEWKRGDAQTIGRVTSVPLDASISRLRWEPVGLHAVKAPAWATAATFSIRLNDGDRGGRGCLLVDDVTLEESAGLPMLRATAPPPPSLP